MRAIQRTWVAGLVVSVALVSLAWSQRKGKQPTDDTSNPAYANAPVSTAAETSGKPAKPAGFVHPGVLVNRAQLDEMKKRVAAGREPQKTAFEALKTHKLGALDYTPHPRATVECGSYSNPDLGCKDEQADSEAAYAQSLLWYITGNPAYAENAVKIMNAWSGTLTGGHTNANGQVQASWTGDVWPRAAEIIRYSYKGWSDGDIAKFQNMLTTQCLPSLIHGTCENGNKELTISEAIINIGVFNDNRAAFDFGIKMWRGRTPATIYLKTDGAKPVEPVGCGPAIWGNKGFTPEFVDGLLQETARDSQHANMAFAGMVDAAETARQQGVDLYAEEGKRIMAAMEFQAQYLAPNGAKAPEKLEFGLHPTWEIAYNQFHNRLGNSLPKMAAVIPTNRPTGVNHHMNWETLTHGEMGSIGLRAAVAPARPTILGIAHMAFYVSDLAKARAFWTDFLGYQECFHLKRKDSDEVRIAFIKINDYQYIELFAEKPRGDRMLNHISFYTENADAMRDYLAAKGVTVADKVGKGQTGNKNYNITDPDGNIVEVVEYQPESWTAREKGKFLPATRISDHVAHVGVLIGSVSAATKFYHDVLGFDEIWRGGGSAEKPLSWINMRVPEGPDYLEFMLHGPTPEPDKYGTKNHLALTVVDCEKAVAILKARAASKDFKMEEMKIGVNRKRQVNLFDADGSRVELMEANTVDGTPTPPSTAVPPIK